MTPSMQNLIRGLTPAELQEMQDIVDYLTEKAGPGNPSGIMPEGSAAALLNRASPNVRARFSDLSQMLETPRTAPFMPKLDEGQQAQVFGLDPAQSVLIKGALDGQEVMARVNERMGTDATLPLQEPTTRDVIAAAMEAHDHE